MKSKFFKVVAGLGVFAFALSVSALDSAVLDSIVDGSNTTDAEATVGSVDTPVYTVAVIWNDLTFDWAFNEDDGTYGWKPSSLCYNLSDSGENGVNNAFSEGLEVFKNDTCTEQASGYDSSINEYYYAADREYATIGIEDISEYAQIVPSIEWKANSKYEDVEAEFWYKAKTCNAVETQGVFDLAKEYGIYSDENCENAVSPTTFESGKYYTYAFKNTELTTVEIPDNGRTSAMGGGYSDGLAFGPFGNQYQVSFKLKGGNTTPVSGDAIGTITVSIRAK